MGFADQDGVPPADEMGQVDASFPKVSRFHCDERSDRRGHAFVGKCGHRAGRDQRRDLDHTHLNQAGADPGDRDDGSGRRGRG